MKHTVVFSHYSQRAERKPIATIDRDNPDYDAILQSVKNDEYVKARAEGRPLPLITTEDN